VTPPTARPSPGPAPAPAQEPPAAREPERKPTPPPAAKPASPPPERKVAAAPAAAPKPEPAKPAPAAAERKEVAAAPPPPKPQPEPARGGFWRDQVLTTKVQAKLQFNRRLWDASGGILVAARSGVVTLTGTVPSREDIAEAERIAAAVDGVTSVRNELRVGAAGSPSGPAN
jgi:hypothetical protein